MKIVLIQELRLDEIVFQHYGGLDNFDLVLEKNPKIAVSEKLNIGSEIILPEVEKKSNTNEIKTLWD